mmetsp:Transcript_94658/g.291853  ORF Transcript_94658/g.291853 Transcript_94658/m.291853 type:complete len:216 (+) Transcript_94658:569-1216(+)
MRAGECWRTTDGVGDVARDGGAAVYTAGWPERGGGWAGELTARCSPQAVDGGGATSTMPGGGATTRPPDGGGDSSRLLPACGEGAPGMGPPPAVGSRGTKPRSPGAIWLLLPPPPLLMSCWYSWHRFSSTRCLCCAASRCWCMPCTASRNHSISCQVSLSTAISRAVPSTSPGSWSRAEQTHILSYTSCNSRWRPSPPASAGRPVLSLAGENERT